MSTYGDNIRKIARYKRTEAGQDKTQEKDPILGKRGIAYVAGSDGTIRTQASTPGTADLPDIAAEIAGKLAQEAATDAFKKALQQAYGMDEDTETLENTPEGNFFSADEGLHSAEDVVDGAVSGVLKGIKGLTDPQSSQNVRTRFDGSSEHPLASSSTVATGDDNDAASYENSYSEGTYEGFQSGFYWTASNPAAGEGPLPGIAAARAVNAARAGLFPNAYWDPTSLVQLGSTEWRFTWYENIGLPANNVSIFRQSCPGSLGDSCPASSPTSDTYPEYYESVLTLNPNGRYTSNQFDKSEVGEAFRNGSSTVVLNFASGSRKIVFEPGVDNTVLIYEVDSDGAIISTIQQFGKPTLTQIHNNLNLPGVGGIQISNNPPQFNNGLVLKDQFDSSKINTLRAPSAKNTVLRIDGVKKP